MTYDGTLYSVLVVSAAEKFNASLLPLLPHGSFDPVVFVSSVAQARRELADRAYDILLINAPLPDDFGTRLALDAGASGGCVAMMIVKTELFEEQSAALLPMGVFTLEKPLSVSAMTRALSWLTAARERLRAAEEKTQSVEEKMAEIRLINRAKWQLIEHEDMTEAEAHRHIEKAAMDRCVPKKRVAEDILAKYKQ